MRRKRYMIDTNVFIAAFKSGYTATTKLLLELIFDDSIELVGDDVLIKEYEKWFNIITAKYTEIKDLATLLLTLILSRIKVVEPEPSHMEKVKKYIPETEEADAYHAATCLKTGATLITNDRDFQELKKNKIINVWTITEAIRNILGRQAK